MAGWGSSSSNAWRGDGGGGWWDYRTSEWRHGWQPSSQVAGSAASRSVQPRDVCVWTEHPDMKDHPGLRYFDNQNIQDMNRDAQEEAKTPSRRVEKLGKAFQNYRKAILKIHQNMMKKNSFLWHGVMF